MPNPHINPNPSPKAQSLSKGRKFKDQSGADIDEVDLIYELAPDQRPLRDVRMQGNKLQKEVGTHYLKSAVTGKTLERYWEWIDA